MVYCEISELQKIVSILPGYPLRRHVPENPRGEYGIVQLRDVDPGHEIDWEQLARMDATAKRAPDFLRSGDVIFSGRGTRVYAVEVESCPENVVVAPQFFVLRGDGSNDLAAYLAWYINATVAQQYFSVYAGGTTIRNVTRSVLSKLPVAMPGDNDMTGFVRLIGLLQRERKLNERLFSARQQLLESLVGQTGG